MQAEVEQGELQLSHQEQASVEMPRRLHLVEQRLRQQLAALPVLREQVQRGAFPAEVLHELAGQFDGIPFHAGDPADRWPGHFGQHVVQAVAEFVKQGQHFVVAE